MGRFLSEGECDRARAWASLELDGELSQLEQTRLAAHVSRCEPCAVFVASLRSVTEIVRTAPLEARERPFRFPPRVPVVRERRLALRLALATSLAALAAGFGAVAGLLARGSEEPVTPTDGDVALITPGATNEPVGPGSVRQAPTERENRLFPPRRLGGKL
jgi:anti-sigma factor RsiW